MPTVRKLAPDEVQTIQSKGKGLRKLTEEQYDRYLADFASGDYGEAILDEGEHRLTVRNRFKAAATRRGLTLEFRRTSDPLVRFKVIAENGHVEEQPEAAAPEPEPEPELPPAPAKSKGGRPKKQAI
jgi:hypothetical protein